MLPMGYESGARRRLNVVETRPSDREAPHFDLSDYIAAVNRMKAAIPALNEYGPQLRLSDPEAAVLALLRWTEQRDDFALVLVNTDREIAHELDPDLALAAVDENVELSDATPGAAHADIIPRRLLLPPGEVRVLHGRIR